jgi:hypothetical protein
MADHSLEELILLRQGKSDESIETSKAGIRVIHPF